MHRRKLFLLMLLTFSMFSIPVQSIEERELSYSYTPDGNSQINITISEGGYEVYSDIPRYNQLSSDQFMFDWDAFLRTADADNFFTIVKIGDNPNLELSIKNSTHSNTIKLNLDKSEDQYLDRLSIHLDATIYRILGGYTHHPIWPVQIQPIQINTTDNKISTSILFQSNNEYIGGTGEKITLYFGENLQFSNFHDWIELAPLSHVETFAIMNPKDSYLLNASDLILPDKLINVDPSEIDIVGIMNSGPVIIVSKDDQSKEISEIEDRYYNYAIEFSNIGTFLDSEEEDSPIPTLYTLSLTGLFLAMYIRKFITTRKNKNH